MTAAPPDHQVWKQRLLAGQVDPEIARQCGALLGRIHRLTWNRPDICQALDDRQIFDQLRLDPYYRFLGRVHSECAPVFERLIDSVWSHRRSLVHADFSPKNLLVYDRGLLLVDFETGHFGDPAFDLGFFLSHLVLKAALKAPGHELYLALTSAFWSTYRAELAEAVGPAEWSSLESRAVQNFAGCAWARLDGKSKVDYLTESARRDSVRSLCRNLFDDPPADWMGVLERLQQVNVFA